MLYSVRRHFLKKINEAKLGGSLMDCELVGARSTANFLGMVSAYLLPIVTGLDTVLLRLIYSTGSVSSKQTESNMPTV